MQISNELIPKYNNYTGWNSYSALETKDVVFLIIVYLNLNKKINDKKMNAMFKGLREDTLLRKVNTYHCKINDKWYNDEHMYTILLDVYNGDYTLSKLPIPVETILKYINLYLNKPKNYCIDHLYHSFIQPFIDNIQSEQNIKLLRTFAVYDKDYILTTYEDLDRRYDLGSGYCCEDCDGCYSEFKRSRFNFLYGKEQREKAIKLFTEYLDTLRTEGYLKNPRRKLYY